MRDAGTLAVAMYVDREIFPASFLVHAIGFLAGVADRSPEGAMIALQNVIHIQPSFTKS
jgi:hypothetical protein